MWLNQLEGLASQTEPALAGLHLSPVRGGMLCDEMVRRARCGVVRSLGQCDCVVMADLCVTTVNQAYHACVSYLCPVQAFWACHVFILLLPLNVFF